MQFVCLGTCEREPLIVSGIDLKDNELEVLVLGCHNYNRVIRGYNVDSSLFYMGIHLTVANRGTRGGMGG